MIEGQTVDRWRKSEVELQIGLPLLLLLSLSWWLVWPRELLLVSSSAAPSLAVSDFMADANAADAAQPTDYVRVKRKKTTIFLWVDPKEYTVHDLRARINHITKVPTTDVKFFIDPHGEIAVDEMKSLEDQKVNRRRRTAICVLPRCCTAIKAFKLMHRRERMASKQPW